MRSWFGSAVLACSIHSFLAEVTSSRSNCWPTKTGYPRSVADAQMDGMTASGAKQPVAIRLLHQVKMAADYRSELDTTKAAKGQPSATPTASGDGAPTVDAAEARQQIGGHDVGLRRHPVRLTSRNRRFGTRCCGFFSDRSTLLNDEGTAIRLTTCPLRGGLRRH